MEEMVKLLPAEERGVFILKSVLDLDFNQIAAITGMTLEQVHRLWSESLLHVRDLWLKKAS
jgi:DNA-directed RNA polymerase specialized sigma24 family protein